MKLPKRILICYDREDDDPLPATRDGAVLSDIQASNAPYAVMLPTDDNNNVGIIDVMVRQADVDDDIVCASRSMLGGGMVAAPVRVGNSTPLPTRGASNSFRLFSRRVMDRIAVESDRGLCYSIELLVKSHRLGWRIGEVPAHWLERKHGSRQFQILKRLPSYLSWYLYAFATTWLRRPPRTVRMTGSTG